MMLKDILAGKGSSVKKISADARLDEVAHKLVEYNIGSLIVCESGQERLVGIITERDVIRVCASGKCTLAEVKVSEVMTTDLITAKPDDKVDGVMGLMTERRFRHLPVLLKGRLVGLVSIGDVVKAQHDRLAMENQAMKDYIQS